MATLEEQTAEGQRVVAEDRDHIIHSWSVQSAISPLAVAGGEGRYFWDYDGKRYLDFASQLVNLNIGHQHPKIVAAIKEQADRLCTIAPPFANDKRSELARLIAEVMPGDLNRTFFTNGGAEANENAVKLARWVTGRHKVIARYRSYHGATAGAITLTGDPRRWFAEPGIPGVVRMFDPYTYRCPAGHPDPCPVCVASIEAFREEGIVENAAAMGEYLAGVLPGLASRHPSVGEVRGLGLFWGLELVRNRQTREPLVPFNAGGEALEPVTRMMKAALQRGLYPFVHWNVFTVVPPLT